MKQIVYSIIMFSVLLLFPNCEKSVESQESTVVTIDKISVADMLGNNDGNTTDEEIAKLDSFYNINNTGYAVGGGYNNYGNSIPADTVKKYFHVYSPLCKNEIELRNAYKGIAIKTPYVGIFVMNSNTGIKIIKLFRASGPNVCNGAWEEIKIF